MYGQNLGVRPDAPGEPIFTEFCTRVRVPDVFLSFEFQKDRLKNVGAVRGQNFLVSLKRHIAYTTATAQAVKRKQRRRKGPWHAPVPGTVPLTVLLSVLRLSAGLTNSVFAVTGNCGCNRNV